jgi:AraC-like DNA-binding protein
VWLSHTLLLLLLLLVVVYGFAADDPSFFLIRIADFVLFGLLLWRVETLPQLEEQENQPQPQPLPVGMSVVSPSAEELERKTTTDETEIIEEKSIAPAPSQGGSGGESPVSIDLDQIEQLLKKHCADTQLYLQPDLTLPQLASAIGTNRSYLSQYFSRQSITYNTYINNLRINYFVSRCQEAAKAGQPIVAQQLAEESGFSTYRTFSRAFMLRTGQSVSTWMRETGGVIM